MSPLALLGVVWGLGHTVGALNLRRARDAHDDRGGLGGEDRVPRWRAFGMGLLRQPRRTAQAVVTPERAATAVALPNDSLHGRRDVA